MWKFPAASARAIRKPIGPGIYASNSIQKVSRSLGSTSARKDGFVLPRNPDSWIGISGSSYLKSVPSSVSHSHRSKLRYNWLETNHFLPVTFAYHPVKFSVSSTDLVKPLSQLPDNQ
jgi:hypothetical protein